MQASTTVAEATIARAQIKLPKELWDRLKIRAIIEDTSAEQLAAKAFELYLRSKSEE